MQTFKPGQIRRHFIQVPVGSNIAGLFYMFYKFHHTHIVFTKIAFQIYNHSSDVLAQMKLHFVQLEPGLSFRINEVGKIIHLLPHSTFQFYFNVQDKRTLELCLARWWSSLATIDSSYSIQFHSILISPSVSIHLHSSRAYERFVLENHLNNTYEDISGLPIVNWKCLVQPLRPNKDESKIQILSTRDCLSDRRQIYQLILTYNFTLVSIISLASPLLKKKTIFLVKAFRNSNKVSIST